MCRIPLVEFQLWGLNSIISDFLSPWLVNLITFVWAIFLRCWRNRRNPKFKNVILSPRLKHHSNIKEICFFSQYKIYWTLLKLISISFKSFKSIFNLFENHSNQMSRKKSRQIYYCWFFSPRNSVNISDLSFWSDIIAHVTM